jgi:Transglycosylase SLT domain/SPOR domain
MRWLAPACFFLLASMRPLLAAEEPPRIDLTTNPVVSDETPKTICALIEAAALSNGIPIDFFTRLIWKESAFRQDVVSPKGAQGIAQFMPGTATLRQLSDPFDPVEAIPASALYLRDLVERFGNIGLAAGAYNAGEARVLSWLAAGGSLPWETQDYVLAITGRTIEEWSRPEPVLPIGAALLSPGLGADCLTTAGLLAKPGATADLVAGIPRAPWAPWGVQVAGNFSLNRAMASYAVLQKQYGAVLADRLPMVVRTVIRSRGTAPLFQIRLPTDSRDHANAICQKLHALGGACVVMRN